MSPEGLILDLADRYTYSTGRRPELIHASMGFKKVVRKWVNEMWPSMKKECPNFAAEWKWKNIPEGQDMICGFLVQYDINSPEVILLAKTE